MGRACDIHSGLIIAPGLSMRTREQPDGTWLAWIEQDGEPLTCADNIPRSFPGDSCYQAQCRASRWLRDQGMARAPVRCEECRA